MKTLNLVNSSKSDITYFPQKFPDGQQNIVLHREIYAHVIENQVQYSNITIESRLNNWLDLELLCGAVACLREFEIIANINLNIHLYTPYIMGARSDRKFEVGGNNYLRDVICPIINSLNFKSVTCIDPHSDVLEACIKGFRKESNSELVQWSLVELKKNIYIEDQNKAINYLDNIILVSPDAGASKKIYKLAEQIGYKGDIITCSKDRDTEGKLTKTVVPMDKCGHKDFIIIDDICDGGATFINIAKVIKNSTWKGKLYLIVTHGIFSKGFKELSQYFDAIYCTNSYKDIENADYTSYKSNGFVKQLNVF